VTDYGCKNGCGRICRCNENTFDAGVNIQIGTDPMKKLVKTIILTPAYPLIWLALYTDIFDCKACWENRCAERAEAMLAWRVR
jgi:hypothetical protein